MNCKSYDTDMLILVFNCPSQLDMPIVFGTTHIILSEADARWLMENMLFS